MTLAVEVKESEFLIGEDPYVVKQIRVSDDEQNWDRYLDPDEADALVDKLITALYDVDFYENPFPDEDAVETQEED